MDKEFFELNIAPAAGTDQVNTGYSANFLK